jgi:hypothetical protein
LSGAFPFMQIIDPLTEAFVDGSLQVFDPSIHHLIKPHYNLHPFIESIRKFARLQGFPAADRLFMFVDERRNTLVVAVWEGNPPREDYPTAMQPIKAWDKYMPDFSESGAYMVARLARPAWSQASEVRHQLRSNFMEKAQRKLDRYDDRQQFIDHYKSKGNMAMVKRILSKPWALPDEED